MQEAKVEKPFEANQNSLNFGFYKLYTKKLTPSAFDDFSQQNL